MIDVGLPQGHIEKGVHKVNVHGMFPHKGQEFSQKGNAARKG